MPVLDIKITALEALKPFTIRSFTKSRLTVSTWEHSMSLSRSFLQMKAENQNFPQMTRIRLENWHLRSRINLWCKHKFTNVVMVMLTDVRVYCVTFLICLFSTSIYRCSYISKNGGSKVVHLILCLQMNFAFMRVKKWWMTIVFTFHFQLKLFMTNTSWLC